MKTFFHRLCTFLIITWKFIFLKDPKEKEFLGFMIAERLSFLYYPKHHFSDRGRLWLEDKEFFRMYEKYERANYLSADRKNFLKSIIKLVDGLDGDTAECGAYLGASSDFICQAIKNTGKKHHCFDSFDGLPDPGKFDGGFWSKGAFKTDFSQVQKNLSAYSFVVYHKGWIPETFEAVKERRFSFVHIDVDLYQPTHDALSFFYPRMVPGGTILCDDYGFDTCPGVKKAFDEYFTGASTSRDDNEVSPGPATGGPRTSEEFGFADSERSGLYKKSKPEKVIDVPTGQCFIIKKPSHA